ncbi:hypothetical protein F7725_002238 [Dissostichus mawsoni]|uniref:Uncharacterized protein n=1 Tax=Dissostichus mawsoni TaxID=36200 RepID=A0A7J5Y3P1_DISMA|nr:hypothetical protein F7725_002238 [Dissostichus mawsoni]
MRISYGSTKALCLNYACIQLSLLNIVDDEHHNLSTREEARVLHKNMNKLEIALMCNMWNAILQRFQGVSAALQAVELDLCNAVDLVRSLREYVAGLRDQFDNFETAAKNMSPTITEQTLNEREKRKSQADDSSEPECELSGRSRFRTSVFIRVIDRLVSELDRRYQSYNDVCENFGFLNRFHSISPKTCAQQRGACNKILQGLGRGICGGSCTLQELDLSECISNYVPKRFYSRTGPKTIRGREAALKEARQEVACKPWLRSWLPEWLQLFTSSPEDLSQASNPFLGYDLVLGGPRILRKVSGRGKAKIPARAPVVPAPFPDPVQEPFAVPSRVPSQVPSRVPSQALSRVPFQVPSQVSSRVPSQSPLKSPLKFPLESPLEFPLESPLKSPLKFPLESSLVFPLESPLKPSLESLSRSLLRSPLESSLKPLLKPLLKSLLEFPLEFPLGSPLKFPLESPLEFPLESPLEFPLKSLLESPLKPSLESLSKSLLKSPLKSPLESLSKSLLQSLLESPLNDTDPENSTYVEMRKAPRPCSPVDIYCG